MWCNSTSGTVTKACVDVEPEDNSRDTPYSSHSEKLTTVNGTMFPGETLVGVVEEVGEAVERDEF